MPDTYFDRVLAALNRKIPQPTCPLCGVSSWAVQDGIFTFHQEIKTQYVSSIGRGLPCAALVCQNCGNTHFINLAVLDPSILKDFT
jgi:hypothetical protein